MTTESFILELTRSEIGLVAAVAHTVLLRYPEHETAKSIIETLIQQISFVKADPAEHGIGIITKKNYHYEAFTNQTNAETASELDMNVMLGNMKEGYYEF